MFPILNLKIENPFIKSALLGLIAGILLEFFLILFSVLISFVFFSFFGATSFNSSSSLFLIAFYIISTFLVIFIRFFFAFLVGFASSYFLKSFPQLKRILFAGIAGITNAVGAFILDIILIIIGLLLFFIISAFSSFSSGGMGLQLFFMQAFLSLLGLVFYFFLLLISLMIGIFLGALLGSLGGLVSIIVFPSQLKETASNISVKSFVVERSLKKK